MEQLTIHSKDYLIRWITVPAGHTISWSLTPKSHSIQFGVVKHPGQSNGGPPALLPTTSSNTTTGASSIADLGKNADAGSKSRRSSMQLHEPVSSVQDKFGRLGIKSVVWVGKCEADRVTMGHYDVADKPGMYGLVFDNTHSRQLSKNVTLVLMTYLTQAPPKSEHSHQFAQAMARKSSGATLKGGKPVSPALRPSDKPDESMPKDLKGDDALPLTKGSAAQRSFDSDGNEFFSGVLNKKRRKRNQGHARRFFSLDFGTATLSYYKNRNSPALRGAIPLYLAAIGANAKSRQISIDSGAEVWLLRALNQKDFEGWSAALDRASQAPYPDVSFSGSNQPADARASPLEIREWFSIEALVGRLSTVNDSVRSLVKDTDPKHTLNGQASPISLEIPAQQDYFGSATSDSPVESRPTSFWRRRKSSNNNSGRPAFTITKRSASSSKLPASPAPGATSPGNLEIPRSRPASRGSASHPAEDEVHNRCMAILQELDSVVSGFSSLLAESKARRLPSRPLLENRLSLESTRSQEFFDAQDGGGTLRESGSHLLQIRDDDQVLLTPPENDNDAASHYSSSSSVDDEAIEPKSGSIAEAAVHSQHQRAVQPPGAFPVQPPSYLPLPLKSTIESIKRRTTIPASTAAPPSLISFLRKNVGKDLSTIAMPVTANEPLSLLQRQAEALEYSELLDKAASPDTTSSTERLLLVTAFAMSVLSSTRDKARAIRKPFNPMLGETYELVREDRGFRFIAEKVTHRPVRVACQAESMHGWAFSQAPAPEQKFWGKSAELITDGHVRVVLHAHASPAGERYSWQPPTCFLRNVIAGEKYVEPVGSFSVVCETTGQRATATFKAGGMFSGRSEEVTVSTSDDSLGLVGKWTSHLDFSDGRRAWTAGELVANAGARYGMTAFAASLNQLTPLEEGAVPPTDSRLRPDQRRYEDGDVDAAEALKAKLEESQRRRRKDMEARGEEWVPRWFEKVDPPSAGTADAAEQIWALKNDEGQGGYWEVRDAVVNFKGGRWDGVRSVFDTA